MKIFGICTKKRRGLAFMLEFALFAIFIFIIMGAGFFYQERKQNSALRSRQYEMQMITSALTLYAKTHKGVLPTRSDGRYEFTTVTRSGSAKIERMRYKSPGIYPKDLYELCDQGYLPAGFLNDLKGYNSTTASATGTTVQTKYGNATKGQYTYKVVADTSDGASGATKQFTYYELSFSSSSPKVDLMTIKQKSY